jgi:hypothetical protein
MVGSGENEVWTFVVEVFEQELLRRVILVWKRRWNEGGFDGVLHS